MFKSTGQTNVKFHQASAAVFLAVAKKLEEFEQNYLKYHSDPVKVAEQIHTSDLNHAVEFIAYHKRNEKKGVLSKIFGDNLHGTSEEELDAMYDFISDVAHGIQNASDDRALNNVMNNYRYVDQTGRFPSYIDEEPRRAQFKGRLVINHSYQKKDTFEHGDTVNIVLTLDRGDASSLVDVVQPQLEALGLIVGRLTSTTDTAERHVSFGLRMSYTHELGQLVQKLNTQVLPNMILETAAQLQVVTPMDIRTSRSAISLLSPETCELLRTLQHQIYVASGAPGNDLPRMHITHGNSPIIAATHDDILAFLDNTRVDWESALHSALEQYGLNLKDALKTKVNTELFQELFINGDSNQRFPTCYFDIPQAVEKIRLDIAESNQTKYRLGHFIAVLKFLTEYENDLPTPYVLEKQKKYDYQRPLARFFAWVAHEDMNALFSEERFTWLYQNFPESGQSARDVAVIFNKTEFLLKLFEITSIAKRPEFIKCSLSIAAAMNNIPMLELLLNAARNHVGSMSATENEIHGNLHHFISECIRYNHFEALEFLLQQGLKVDFPSDKASMDSFLCFASRMGSLASVDLLIKYGANVNFKPRVGDTALVDAVKAKQWDIAKRLIQAGASIDTGKNGKTIFDLIASEEIRTEIKSLFEACQMHTKTDALSGPSNKIIVSNRAFSIWQKEPVKESLQEDARQTKEFK